VRAGDDEEVSPVSGHAWDDSELPIDPDVASADLAPPKPDGHRPARVEPKVLAVIAAGGALGAPARYGVAQVIHVAKDTFPWATLVTNLSGSFALGFILVLLIERFPPTRYLRPFFATGFLGAFTTFSTFVVESDVLIKDGHVSLAVVYVITSAAAGLAAVWIGIVLGHRVPLPVRHDRSSATGR
jgi:CrcB protein